MAKLPTAQDLDVRVPVDRSQVVTGNIDLSGYQALGRSAENFGRTVQDRQDALNLQKAKTLWQKAKIEADNAFDQDNDFGTYVERYNGMLGKASEEALKQVNNPRLKELLKMDIDLSKADGLERMKDRAYQKESESGLSTLQEILTINRENALRATSDADRMSAFDQMNDSIAIAEMNGYVKKDDATNLRIKSGQDMAKAMVDVQPLEKQLELLRSGQGYAAMIPSDERKVMEERALSKMATQQLLGERMNKLEVKRQYLNALNSVQQTGSVDSIPIDVLNKMDATQRKGIFTYAKALAGGSYIATDYKRYYDLVRMAQSDPKAFAEYDLGQDRMRLGNAEFKQLAGKQTSILEGAETESKNDPLFTSILNDKQAVDNAIMGITGKKSRTKFDEEDTEFANAMYRIVDEEKRTWLENNPEAKKVPPEVRDQIIDKLTMKTTQPGTLFGVDALWPDADQTIIDEIAADLKKANKPVNAYTIYSTYKRARAAGVIE